MYVCVYLRVRKRFLRNARNVYCSVWEGVMGGRLLCFTVLGTADLSLTPVSRGHVVQKKKKKAKQRDVCVWVYFLTSYLSVENSPSESSMFECVCVWAHKSLCDRVKQAFTNKKNNKRNKTARCVERDEPGCQRRNSLPGRMFQMNTNKQNCEIE